MADRRKNMAEKKKVPAVVAPVNADKKKALETAIAP